VAKHKYKPGQVVWAKVADRNGVVKDAPRPVLVLMVHPTVRSADLVGLAVSTRADIHPEDDPVIEMPWDAQTGSCTGLFEWCAAVLLWRVIVPQSDIERMSGTVPPEFMSSLEERLKEAEFWHAQKRK
jgi:hypothetical protein